MIGDDVLSDVGAAQQCGMRAVLVRTGKYRYIYPRHVAQHVVASGQHTL